MNDLGMLRAAKHAEVVQQSFNACKEQWIEEE
jgi:hypothetical protein